MFGLSGASRSGKSTLAKRMSEALEIPYVDSSTTALMAEAGFNPVSAMDIDTRIRAQEHLLDAYIRLVDRQGRNFVTDRTPIDMLAYTLGEVTMHNTNEEQGKRIAEYCRRCVASSESRFALIIVTLPLATYEVRPDKPPPSLAYQDLIHNLITGALRNSVIPTMHLDADSVENRLLRVINSLGSWRHTLSEQMAQEVRH